MNMKTDFWLPIMVLFAGNAYAMDWLFEPDFNFKERYDDNLRMQLHPIRSHLISTLSPGLMLGYLADNNELKTHLKWNELLYHSESELDFSEKLINVSHQHQAERFKTELAANYAEESSLNTQLDVTGSGNLNTQVPRTTKSISPGITYNLTESNALKFDYSHTDVTFEKNQAAGRNSNFSDYTNQQISATAIHTFSTRLSFNFSGSYSKFDSSNQTPGSSTFKQNSTTLNYQAGMQYAFNERMQLSLSAGIRDTDTQTTSNNFSQSRNTSGHVFSASLTRSSERGSFSLNAGQQLNPASTGTQQQSTSFSASAKYNLTERCSTGMTASYLISESVGLDNANTSSNRTYATVSPNIEWRWTPEINLELSYNYRQQQFETQNQAAIGNSVQLQFSYQPQINRQVK